MEAEQKANVLTPQSIRSLGKLVLEFEQVNSNLAAIQAQIRQDIRDKKKYFDEEKKLFKKEEDTLVGLRGAFFETRGKIAAVSALLAGKALLEGRFGDAAIDAGVAVGAMLPEIVNIASSLVLGRLALGGGLGRLGLGAAARTGGMALPSLARGAGLVGLGAAVPLAMGAADIRRQDLYRRQFYYSTITPRDVDRFNTTVNRFDAILSRSAGGQELPEPSKVAQEQDDAENKKIDQEDKKRPIARASAGVTIKDEKQALKELGVTQEQYNAFKQGVADVEGARYNQMGGAGGAFAGRYQMGSGEIATSAAIMGIPTPTQKEYLENPVLQEKIYMGRTIYMHRRMLQLSRKYNQMSPLQRLSVLGGGQLGEGSLANYLEKGRVTIDTNETPITRWNRAVQRRLNELKPTEDPKAQSMLPAQTNIITIPGQTKTQPIPKPAKGPSSSEVAFNTEFESIDRFTSKILLGAYS